MDHRAMAPGEESSGFTLIEVLISLVLFALISLAGISLVQTVIDVQTRTETRGERLAEVQRALYLLNADLEQMSAEPSIRNGAIQITRSGEAGDFDVSYTLSDGTLQRASGGQSAPVLDGIAGLAMRVLIGNQWSDIGQITEDSPMPRAIEITMMLAARPNEPAGPIRRVIELPVIAP